ncbi:MAG: bifunctional 4-hydroxy-2-oxoglutarate aldolase/2-dehydro-3-deoxy-phosphogluconate aldolase [Bacteroidota bacterium]
MALRSFKDAFQDMPLIPALRGISEAEVREVGQILLDNGITIFEVPIRTGNAIFSQIDNTAIHCIEILVDTFGEYVNISAGTVMKITDLDKLVTIGIKDCFSINLNTELLESAKERNFSFFPGIETVTEAINAVKSGADGIKLFPSVFRNPDSSINAYHPPGYVNYLGKFVDCPIIPSGNAFNEMTVKHYFSCGANGLNIGSQIYEPNINLWNLEARVKKMVSFIKKYR